MTNPTKPSARRVTPISSPHSAIQDRKQSAHDAVQALIATQAEEQK